jgi:hypothetical protein
VSWCESLCRGTASDALALVDVGHDAPQVEVPGSATFDHEHRATFVGELGGDPVACRGELGLVDVPGEHVGRAGEGVGGTTGHGLGHVVEPSGEAVGLVYSERAR